MIPRFPEGVDLKPERAARFDQKTIGDRMRRAREAAGLSRAALGSQVGLTDDSLRKKEKGVNPFYFDELSRICDLLDAPSLFPILEWGEAFLADKVLGRSKDSKD